MRIYQLLPTLSYGDAVGNDTVAIWCLLKDMGYETAIFAENIDGRLVDIDVKYYYDMPELSKDDIILYHFSTGSDVMYTLLKKSVARKIMIYHNITPSHFFSSYNKNIEELVKTGREDLRRMSNLFECCFAASEFNKLDLIEHGYQCSIAVLPILIPFGDYDKTPDGEIIEKYENDGYINWLFVGRIAPNKRQENIIRAFAYYKKYLNSKSRLFLVGSYAGMEPYYENLQHYVEELSLEKDVTFTGAIPFNQILAYYNIATVFVCLSEHEGFCVPLLEAMKFNIPIVANEYSAIPETAGKAAVLVNGTRYIEVAMAVNLLLKNTDAIQYLQDKGKERIEFFSHNNISNLFKRLLNNAINKNYRFTSYVDFNYDDNQVISDLKSRIDEKVNEINNIEPLPEYVVIATEIKSNTSQINNKEKLNFKQRLKKYIFKPGYSMVSKISPELALRIKNKAYTVWHNIKNKEKIVNTIKRRQNSNILIDTTLISRIDYNTGIQRVVNNISHNLYSLTDEAQVIKVNQDKVITSNGYEAKITAKKIEESDYILEPVTGDRVLFLDSVWDDYFHYEKLLSNLSSKDLKTCAVIYDLFPLQYPEFFGGASPKAFQKWVDMTLESCSSMCCISKTVADNLIAYYNERGIVREKDLHIHYFHMGAHFEQVNGFVRDEIKTFIRENTFLMVGTIEPRKGYAVALEAFDKLIDDMVDVRLLIIGKDGWKNKDFHKKFKELEKKTGNVMWIDDASDAELQWAYNNSSALIAASRDEGFGLPLVEAAYYGIPIICSDIPIFREVTKNNADFFEVMNPFALKNKIKEWINVDIHPDSKKIRIYTWKESAKEILDILNDKKAPYAVIKGKNDKNRKTSILTDVTAITKSDGGTGIQRVVNEVFCSIKSADVDITPVKETEGVLTTSNEFLRRHVEKYVPSMDNRVQFERGDKLFLLDSSWEHAGFYEKQIKLAKENCVSTSAVVYDLFPIQYPEWFSSQYFVDVFTQWHNMVINHCDKLVCISRTTADSVISYYKKAGIKRNTPLEIYYFHLGASITPKDGEIRNNLKEFCSKKNVFLMVGTVENRKGHAVVLKGIRRIIEHRKDIHLLIMGRNGWLNDEFTCMLSEVPSGHVMWIQDASDEEIQYAYKNSIALIAASKDEGFGLPIVEAAYWNLPIICSDIPVFHEVSQEKATFFKTFDSDDLSIVLKEWMEAENHPESSEVHVYSWNESAEEIIDILHGNVDPYCILK